MNGKIIIENLFKAYEFLISLNKPIGGKPLFDWFKLAFLYSFVIWLSIIGWKFYQCYLQFQNLKKQKSDILVMKKYKENQIRKYISKLRDIDIAYKQISKYLSEKRVKNLVKKLNEEILLYKQKERERELYNPISISLLNIGDIEIAKNIYVYFPKYYLIKNKNLSYRTAISKFLTSINYFYSFYKKNYNHSIKGKVNVSLVGKKIVLFFEPKGESVLSIKPIMLNGLIQHIDNFVSMPTYTFFDTKVYFGKKISNVFFGWSFELEKEGNKNE